MVRINKAQNKEALLEIMEENPKYFKTIFIEILEEKPDFFLVLLQGLIEERKKKLETEAEQDALFEKILDEDFAEYKNVFNRLA
jgi:hypothetical protein